MVSVLDLSKTERVVKIGDIEAKLRVLVYGEQLQILKELEEEKLDLNTTYGLSCLALKQLSFSLVSFGDKVFSSREEKIEFLKSLPVPIVSRLQEAIGEMMVEQDKIFEELKKK